MKTSDIPIATPCGQDWTSMSPREKSRFCGECKKVVHDLRSMKEKDAKKLLSTPATEGLCVRYMYDEQGNVWFQDTMFMRTEGLLRNVAATAALAAAPFLTACMGSAAPIPGDGWSDTSNQVDPAVRTDDDAGQNPNADGGPATDTDAGPIDPGTADGGADAATDPNADPDAAVDPNADPDAAVDPGVDPNADPDAAVDPGVDPGADDAGVPAADDAGAPRPCRDKHGHMFRRCDQDGGGRRRH